MVLRFAPKEQRATLSVHDFVALAPRRGDYQVGSGLSGNAQLLTLAAVGNIQTKVQ